MNIPTHLTRLIAGVSPSRAAAVLSGLSFAAVAAAVALQVAFDFYPCPWCILQRYAFLAMALVLAARALPGSPSKNGPLNVAAGLVATTGAGMAAFQLYVKLVPSASCGKDAVADFVNGLWPARAVPAVFEATGSCIDPIPVNFPLLSLGGFIALALCTYLLVRTRRVF